MSIKILTGCVLVLLALVNYGLWFGQNGVTDYIKMSKDIDTARAQIDELQDRNANLRAEVNDLKKGVDASEERARNDLGLIRDGEVFFQIIEGNKTSSTTD
jgi:cell division protein FtsB